MHFAEVCINSSAAFFPSSTLFFLSFFLLFLALFFFIGNEPRGAELGPKAVVVEVDQIPIVKVAVEFWDHGVNPGALNARHDGSHFRLHFSWHVERCLRETNKRCQ